MKRILVTGGAGYIGSHTVIELLKNPEYEVIIIDDFSNSNLLILNKLHNIVGKNINIHTRNCKDDISDILTKYNGPYSLEEDKIVGVIHFAAYKAVGESVDNPLKYYDNNINSLLNILNSCKNYGIKNIVFSSSCSLYGNVGNRIPLLNGLPVNEDTPLSDPESPYAYTKLIGERILSDFCKVN